MKVLVILEIEPDKVLDSYKEGRNQDEIITLEDAIQNELRWVIESGIYSKDIILPDNEIFQNTDDLLERAHLGSRIIKLMNE